MTEKQLEIRCNLFKQKLFGQFGIKGVFFFTINSLLKNIRVGVALAPFPSISKRNGWLTWLLVETFFQLRSNIETMHQT